MLVLVLLATLSVLEGQKIGLLYSANSTYKTALEHLSSHAASKENVTLVIEEYEPSTRGVTEACCRLVEAGVSAIISKSTSTNTAIQADILSPLKIPLISVSATDPYLSTSKRGYLLRMAPSDKYQSRAIFDLIKHFKWKHVSILASSGSYGIHGSLELRYLLMKDSGHLLESLIFFDDDDSDYGLDELKVSLARVIILYCDSAYGKVILTKAYDMGLLDSGFVWIISDAITTQPEVLVNENGVYLSYHEGLIGIRPAVNKSQKYQDFKDEYLQGNHTLPELTSYTLMAYDAVGLTATAVRNLPALPEQNIGCSSTEGWSGGESLLSALVNVTYTGITGQINFTESGESRKVVFDVVNFREDRFDTVGTWHNTSHLQMTVPIKFLGNTDDVPSGVANHLNGEHLRIGALDEPPFIYHAGSDCEGKDCWSGICPDIMTRLSEDLGFTYEYLMPEDGKWGGYNATSKQWNGMVSELISGRIDIIAAPLSTNAARKEVIDFSTSFMDSAIAAAVIGESETRNIFFFLASLNGGVWLSVIAANFVVTILIWVLGKISSVGKHCTKVRAMQNCSCDKCKTARVNLEETSPIKSGCLIEELKGESDNNGDTSFYESTWLIITGLVAQSGDTLPRSMSGRALVFTWWAFMLLIISSYTANLTAFLTLSNVDTSFQNILELLDQDEYQWGVSGSTHTEVLLLNHKDPIYAKIVEKGIRIDSNEEGLERLRNGRFVYIDEMPIFDFQLRADCDISFIGEEFQPFEYAFGLPKDSPYINLVDKQMLQYREEGMVDELWDKWTWTDEPGCSRKVGSVLTLDMEMLAGMFYILFIGILSSIGLLVVEFIYASILDVRRDAELGVNQAMKNRLVFLKEHISRQGKRTAGCESGESKRKTTVIENTISTIVEEEYYIAVTDI